MQTQPLQGPQYKGITHCTSSIIKNEGFYALYRGLVPPLGGVAFLNAIVFGVFGTMRRFLKGSSTDPLTLSQICLCGNVAGVFSAAISGPTELLKCRMQVSTGDPRKIKTLNVAREIVRAKGIRGLAMGTGMTLIRDAPSFGAYFVAYEAVLRGIRSPEDSRTFEFLKLNFAGGVAGVVGWSVIYPIDVVKSKLQTQSLTEPQFRGAWHCAQQLLRAEGLRAFFRGYNATMVRAFPLNAVTFSVYELTLRFLDQRTH
eukprot:m.109190 g.109190  ORF g.109190 m.109190 type:complete len:257 (-) comp15963_c0_seq2:36-806(-)